MVSNYPVSFYFQLSFGGVDAAFQEVTGISKELSVEEVVCGGENRFKYKLPTASTSQNLVLKRAMVSGYSDLLKWCSDCVDSGLVKPIMPRDVSVSLLDAMGQVRTMWTFHKAYPVKYSVSELKSQDNALVIESMELAYTYFEVAQETVISYLFDMTWQ